ncbi:jg2363 [Pararge aegeria aegeria]|uniref:Jg2363 protein n=1 Tax=Pararge aegeria aegeria TaxID=348720 RepID=A0A8S4SE81_9NEOP|nr:jg2363 [Pararge aegeria aegeria]
MVIIIRAKTEQTNDDSKHDNRALPTKQTPFATKQADEAPTHVLLQCRGIAEQGVAYLRSPASLPEALGDPGGLLSFWSELGWLE